MQIHFSQLLESTTNPKPRQSSLLPRKFISLTSAPLTNNARIQHKVSMIFFINFGWYSEIFSLGLILLSVKEEDRFFFPKNTPVT